MKYSGEIIRSLQGLRFIGVLFVFCSHIVSSSALFCGAGGPLGVSFFILLSGFFMTLHYGDRDLKFSFAGCFEFARKKVIKFYGIHLLTLFGAVPFVIYGVYKGFETFGQMVFSFVANLFLFQAFVPLSQVYFSFNAVSWFLSITAFFYFLSPLVFKFFRRIDSVLKILFMILGLYFIEYIYVMLFQTFELEHWLIYINPVYRLSEFIIGGLLAKLYKNINLPQWSRLYYSSVEIILISLIIAFLSYYPNVFKALSMQLYFSPVLACVIFFFSFSRGYIALFLSKKMLVYLGDSSMEFYLLHQLIIRYADVFRKHFGVEFGILWTLVILMLALILSAFLHYCLRKQFLLKKKQTK